MTSPGHSWRRRFGYRARQFDSSYQNLPRATFYSNDYYERFTPGCVKSFVDDQVTSGGYSTSSEYARELIRKDQDRQRLRDLLDAGTGSQPAAPVDDRYFDGLRARVSRTTHA